MAYCVCRVGTHKQLNGSALCVLNPGASPWFGECARGIQWVGFARCGCGRHRALQQIGGEVLLFLALCELLCAL